MKNIHEILKDYGFEVPADKKEDFDKAVLENYKTVVEAEKLRTARDNYKSQLETAQKSLKEFEGVDVEDLQGKISDLTTQLSTQQSDYETKLADIEFNSILDNAISSAKAKNSKAVRALLDIESLKASKNRSEDIKTALETVKTENDYLFESDEPYLQKQTVGGTQTQTPQSKTVEELSKMSYDQYKAYRNNN